MQEKEIAKQLQCIIVRGGIEIWVEKERAEKLRIVLNQPNCPQFIDYDGRMINRADLVGIYEAVDLEEKTRRYNGQWKCRENYWHDKGEKCDCENRLMIEQAKERAEKMVKCTNCTEQMPGYVYVVNAQGRETVRPCNFCNQYTPTV